MEVSSSGSGSGSEQTLESEEVATERDASELSNDTREALAHDGSEHSSVSIGELTEVIIRPTR